MNVRKYMLPRVIAAWFICFMVLLITVNGMGIFHFERKVDDMSRFLDSTDAVTVQQQGWKYVPRSGGDCLLFDFSKTDMDEAVYGVELTLEEGEEPRDIRAYLGESAIERSDEGWQSIEIEYRHDKLTILFTKGNGCLKLYINQPLNIVSFAIITSSDMMKVYVVLCILVLCVGILYVYWTRDRLTGRLGHLSFLVFIKNKKVRVTLAIFFAECVVLCLAEAVCGGRFNPGRAFLLVCMAAFLTVICRHKESVVRNFHVFYFFLVLMTGTVYIVGCAPYSLDLSWDDQIHYARTNYVARGFHSYETEAGYQLKGHYFDRSTNEENFTQEQRRKLAESIGSLDKNKNYGGFRYVESYHLPSVAVSYLPAAVGLIVGRGLGLPTMISLLLGRWANLCCYALILSYAVWLLRKRGYIMAAFVGMIPTAVYIASNYSYDWWVTAFSVLGYALFENAMQDKESHHSIIMVTVVLFLAFLPKAVYLTLTIPVIAVLAAKGKKNKKGFVAVIAVMLLLAASFIVPLIASKGAAFSDTRGGADVSGVGQIQFILTNPIQYLKTLVRFLWRYINPDKSVEIFGYYILFGTGKYYSIVLILLVLAAFVDNTDIGTEKLRGVNMLRLWSLIGIFTTLALVATSMYISYTPVGLNGINGVQPRYMIPIIFPFLYYVCRVNIDIPQKIKDSVAVYGSMLLSLVLCFNIYVQCICFY